MDGMWKWFHACIQYTLKSPILLDGINGLLSHLPEKLKFIYIISCPLQIAHVDKPSLRTPKESYPFWVLNIARRNLVQLKAMKNTCTLELLTFDGLSTCQVVLGPCMHVCLAWLQPCLGIKLCSFCHGQPARFEGRRRRKGIGSYKFLKSIHACISLPPLFQKATVVTIDPQQLRATFTSTHACMYSMSTWRTSSKTKGNNITKPWVTSRYQKRPASSRIWVPVPSCMM